MKYYRGEIMGNGFVDYMNSMNNANGDTSNALAEAQVNNEYYKDVKVERKLGKQIIQDIREGKRHSYIITGHAGDGKTSILSQVLCDLNALEPDQKLDIKGSINLSNGGKLNYIKDMSELPKEKQVEYMKEILDSPKAGDVGILISNTGPLISTYKEVAKLTDDTSDMNEIENFLLEQLDINRDTLISNNGYEFYLINLARLDNTWFANELIDKITNEKLWVQCEGCDKGEACPIYFNYLCLKENKPSVSRFIEDYYRYLYEQDKRMTIRQIVAHISYALTGNLDCSSPQLAHAKSNKYITYVYNFANLFFGYRGIHAVKEAVQIKSIYEIQNLRLDKKSLKEEYDIFVRNNFSRFNGAIKDVVERYWHSTETRIIYTNLNDDTNDKEVKNTELLKYRQSLRRFLIMYTYYSPREKTTLGTQVFGEMFELFKVSLFKNIPKPELKVFQKIIFNALYINYVGVPPIDSNDLYITLRREDKNQQKALLLLGEAKSSQLIITQKMITNKFEDSKDDEISKKYTMVINMQREHYDLDFPLLNYFYNIAKGAIYGKVNADLSHGLTKLNAKLLRAFKYTNEGSEFKVLVNEGYSTSIRKFEIVDNRLFVE